MPDDRLKKTREAYTPLDFTKGCVCAQLEADGDQIPSGVAMTCPEHPNMTFRRGPISPE